MRWTKSRILGFSMLYAQIFWSAPLLLQLGVLFSLLSSSVHRINHVSLKFITEKIQTISVYTNCEKPQTNEGVRTSNLKNYIRTKHYTYNIGLGCSKLVNSHPAIRDLSCPHVKREEKRPLRTAAQFSVKPIPRHGYVIPIFMTDFFLFLQN